MTTLSGRAAAVGRVLARVFGTTETCPGSVKLQIMSDLHLESQSYPQFQIPRKAPYLVLAGDIGNLADTRQYRDFLKRQCSRFEHVYLVLGNHEFFGYGRSRDDGMIEARRLQKQFSGKLSILYRKRVDIPGSNVTILGCTLHSDVPAAAGTILRRKMMDFRRIDRWTVTKHQKEYEKDVEWLRQRIASISQQEPERRIVVITHYAPSKIGTFNPVHKTSPWESAFSTEILRSKFLDWEGRSAVTCWIFGHTHWNADFTLGNVRVVSNQRGIIASRWIPPTWVQARMRYRGRLRYWIARLTFRTTGFNVKKVITV